MIRRQVSTICCLLSLLSVEYWVNEKKGVYIIAQLAGGK